MKAKDLCELLMRYPDFEVKAVFCEHDPDNRSLIYRDFEVTDVGDIEHSDKVIELDLGEVYRTRWGWRNMDG